MESQSASDELSDLKHAESRAKSATDIQPVNTGAHQMTGRSNLTSIILVATVSFANVLNVSSLANRTRLMLTDVGC